MARVNNSIKTLCQGGIKMDLIKILTNAGVAEDVVKGASEMVKAEIHKEFVKKDQYNKKVGKIDELQTQLDDLNARYKNAGSDDYKAKYEEVSKKLESLEKEKVATTKKAKITEELKKNGYTKDNVLKLMLKGIDFDAITIKENGEIEGFDITGIDKEFSDFKSNSKTMGNPPANPPATGGTQITYTQEKLKSMTPSEIAKNYDAIQKDLAKQNK